MKIAVTYENGEVFGHFGHSKQFKIYEVKDGSVISDEVVDTNGSGHGLLAGFLAELGVDALICGGIGSGAKDALAAKNISVFGGVSGSADTAVKAYLNESLKYNPNAQCSHHSEHNCGGDDCRHGECL